MRTMLNLPVDLGKYILSEWVGCLKGLSNLEVAYIRRPELAEHLSRLPLISTSDFFGKKDTASTSEDLKAIASNPVQYESYLAWMHSRQVHVLTAVVPLQAFPACRERLEQARYPSVLTIKLLGPSLGAEVPSEDDLVKLMTCFPNVQRIDCTDWLLMRDGHLDAISRTATNLISFDLRGGLLAPKALNKAFQRHVSTLRRFYCQPRPVDPVLDLEVIASGTALQCVGFLVDRLSADAIIRFCQASPQLIALEMKMFDPESVGPLNDAIVLQCVPFLKRINELCFYACMEVTCDVLPMIMRCCPHIQCAVSPYFQYNVYSTYFGQPIACCTFEIAPNDSAQIMPILVASTETGRQGLGIPIRDFVIRHDLSVGMDEQSVQFLADQFSLHLDVLVIGVANVPCNTLALLLLRAVNLSVLMLSFAHTLEDWVVGMLPSYCKRLEQVGLTHGALLTDEGMCAFLEQDSAYSSRLLSLQLNGCSKLTELVALTVVRTCSSLRQLSMLGTAVSPAGAMELCKCTSYDGRFAFQCDHLKIGI